MASIVSRSNGTYLVRVSCGVDSGGKQIACSKTFMPLKTNLPYSKLNRELEAFVAAFEQEIENEGPKFYDFKTIFLKPLCNQIPVAKLSRLLIINKCY